MQQIISFYTHIMLFYEWNYDEIIIRICSSFWETAQNMTWGFSHRGICLTHWHRNLSLNDAWNVKQTILREFFDVKMEQFVCFSVSVRREFFDWWVVDGKNATEASRCAFVCHSNLSSMCKCKHFWEWWNLWNFIKCCVNDKILLIGEVGKVKF